VREIFQIKSFRFILFILLFAVCVYPPFRLMTEAGITAERKWECIFTALPTPYEVPEVDLGMLLVEAIIAIPLAIGISLISCAIKTALRRINVERLKGHYLSRKL
jgi:hypothetical protein